jgi:KTSC domain
MTRRRFALRAALALVCAWRANAAPPATPRTPVDSTSLASVGYDAGRQTLEIEFRSGALYRYLAVPAAVHRALMSAESKGRYFSQHIRDRYRFQRLTPAAP